VTGLLLSTIFNERMNMSDLGDFDVAKASEKGFELELLHPVTKEGVGQFVRIFGKESEAYRNWVSESANRERRLAAVAARRGRSAEVRTYEETDEEAISLLVACTIGFRCADVFEIGADGKPTDVVAKKGGNFLRYRGQELTFSPDNAAKFYADPGMIEFRKQIDNAIGDLANFMQS